MFPLLCSRSVNVTTTTCCVSHPLGGHPSLIPHSQPPYPISHQGLLTMLQLSHKSNPLPLSLFRTTSGFFRRLPEDTAASCLSRPQSFLSSAIRVILLTQKWNHVTPVLKQCERAPPPLRTWHVRLFIAIPSWVALQFCLNPPLYATHFSAL